MTADFTDLYKKGENLNHVLKRFITLFKQAEKDENSDLLLIYGEAIRKTTQNVVAIACVVLKIKEIVEGKPRSFE